MRRGDRGNEDLEFYDCWIVAVNEASAIANVNNDMRSAWDEYDAWYVSETQAANQGARPVRRSAHSSRTTASSRPLVTSACLDSQQNFARPVQAPKRRKVNPRPSLASVVDNNKTHSNATQRSVISAVLLSAELAGDQRDEEKDKELAIDIVQQEIKQREGRKRKRDQEKCAEEAATALFMQQKQLVPNESETRKLIQKFRQQEQEEADREVSRRREQEEASMKLIQDMLADDGVF